MTPKSCIADPAAQAAYVATPTWYTATWEDRVVASQLSLDAAAKICCLDRAELAWALDQHGRCDGLDHCGRPVTIEPQEGQR